MQSTDSTITVCIASIPQRVSLLCSIVYAFAPHVDHIKLFLNNYTMEHAQGIMLISPKISAVIHDNSLGDAGKFWFAKNITGYILTHDDDILPAPNYVKQMVEGVERHQRKAVVSCHGRLMKQPPIKSYYKDAEKYFSFNQDLNNDERCHIIGTGCMAWHTDLIKPDIKDFPTSNMADIHFSILAKKKNIPLVVLKHRGSTLQYLQPEFVSQTIFKQYVNGDWEQTNLVNQIADWKN